MSETAITFPPSVLGFGVGQPALGPVTYRADSSGFGVRKVVTHALAGLLATSPVHAFTIDSSFRFESEAPMAETRAATWERVTTSYIDPVRTSVAVQQYCISAPGTDIIALRYIYEMVAISFAGRPVEMAFELSIDFDTEEPLLILSVDTHGMDVDEILDKEIKLRQEIAQSVQLSEAKKYLTLSIF